MNIKDALEFIAGNHREAMFNEKRVLLRISIDQAGPSSRG